MGVGKGVSVRVEHRFPPPTLDEDIKGRCEVDILVRKRRGGRPLSLGPREGGKHGGEARGGRKRGTQRLRVKQVGVSPVSSDLISLGLLKIADRVVISGIYRRKVEKMRDNAKTYGRGPLWSSQLAGRLYVNSFWLRIFKI